jgi:hypothetical protein
MVDVVVVREGSAKLATREEPDGLLVATDMEVQDGIPDRSGTTS